MWRELLSARDDLMALLAADASMVGREAPKRARRVIDLAEQLIANVDAAAWFSTSAESQVAHSMLEVLATAASDVAVGALARFLNEGVTDADAAARGEAVVAAIEQEVWRPADEPPSSVVAAVFQVDPAVLDGMTGLDASARLRVASGMSAQELDGLSRSMLRHLLPSSAAYPPSATSILAALLMTERPFYAHVAALHTRDLILAADVDRASAILNDLRNYLPENWATHRTVVAGLQRLAAASDAEEAALAEADLSWAETEGPVRRFAWTVLRLRGVAGDELPKLAELHGRLRADGAYITTLFAAAIEPGWRNSVAHRQVVWDSSREALVLDGALVAPSRLRVRRSIGTAGCHGFECGVSLARAASQPLARKLDLRARPEDHPQIVRARVADALALHGLVALRIDVGSDRLIVELPDGTAYDAGRIIGELAEARHAYGLERVELRFGERPALLITGKTLAEVMRLRRSARHRRLPASALWPVIAAGRLELGVAIDEAYGETVERASWAAVQVVAPLIGIDVDAPRLSASAARAELGEILAALLASWRVLPGRAPANCAHVAQLLRDASRAIASPRRADLFAAGRALHAVTKRHGPPDPPWFAPLSVGAADAA
jgi:hypothetical protein